MEDHKRKKKRGRSKIFRSCFSSFAADEKLFSYDKSDRRNTRNGRLRKTVLMAVIGRKGKDSIRDVNLINGVLTRSGADCYSKRLSRRRFISRLLKSVWFDSLMVKKIHRSSSKSSISSDNIEPLLSIENTGKSSNDTEDTSGRCLSLLSYSTRTTFRSSSYSSSFSSSTNSNSRQSPDQNTNIANFRHQISSNSQSHLDEKDQHRQVSLDSSNTVSFNSTLVKKLNSPKIKSGSNKNIRLCLFLLLSLAVLIVYGRIYSIMCTSAWFYFLPCRRIKRVNSVFTVAESPEVDSCQYKKRVIMAGSLDRASNPLR